VKRVVILASGSGTLAQAIFDARITTLAEVDIVAVISDNKDAPVIDRAEAAQIESYVIPMMADRTQWDRELETLLSALKFAMPCEQEPRRAEQQFIGLIQVWIPVK